MTRAPQQALSPQILEAASNWFVEFNEGRVDGAAREEFVQWLRVSPEHVRAYLQISAHWEEARVLEATRHKATIDKLIALGRQETHVVPLDREVHSLFPPGPPADSTDEVSSTERAIAANGVAKKSHQRHRALAVAASIVVGIISFWFYSQQDVYATGIGEQRFIKLADGSTIDINARSRIRVSFSGEQRDVELLEGQALFKVAKDTSRPFVVRANRTRITAIGTQFDVYEKSTGIVVTVVEGKVAVSSARGSVSDAFSPGRLRVSDDPSEESGVAAAVRRAPQSVFLSAGEQLTVKPAAIEAPTRADVAAATAWTEKQLIFRSSPLTDVVEEFNRYNARQMIVTDPQLKTIRISGVFSSTDSASLLRGLEAQGTFTIRETADAIEIAPR